MSLKDNPEVWIIELEDIHNQMDEIRLTSQISDDDFKLHIMCNLPEEYEAVLTYLENRLMAESGEKVTGELMHQKLNACFKTCKVKKKKLTSKKKPWLQ